MEAGWYLAVKKELLRMSWVEAEQILQFFVFVDDGFRMPTNIPDWINEEINEEVTHWMPMPQPPKGE